MFSRFNISNVYIDETNIHIPSDSFTFLKEIETSEFIECNYTRAFHFFAEYPSYKKDGELFKRKGRQLLVIAKEILDSMGIPFWLSSGTCLGDSQTN